ncbi:MAG: hypothetical protein ABI451_12130 [Dokdonella sp.]
MSLAASVTVNPLFMRHDLMIELGRLDMVIDKVRSHEPSNDDPATINDLIVRRARLNEALSQLPV